MQYLVRDGIKLFYEQKGTGEKTFLFIHGTGGTSEQLKHEFDYFSKTSKVVTFDLRGHGQSDQSDAPYSIESFAQDIHWLCAELQITNAIVVGASMGGNIALELAAEYPQLVSGIVLLDSAFLYSKDVLEMIGFYADEIEKDNKACIEKLLNNSCLKTDTCAPFLESMYLETSPSVWRSCFLEMIRWDKDKVKDQINKIHVPILYIEAENRIIDMPAFKALYPGLMTAKVVSSGHLLSLEVPEQINPMIERFSLTALH